MTNGKNSFLQVVKLPNVRGRVRYISDPKRQENLYATFTNVESKYWIYLSKENQKDFTRAPGSFKVSEKLFDFISQHSREKLKIGFEIDTEAKANNAENEEIGTIKEVTLQNE